MKKLFLLLLAIPVIGYSQIPSYYSDVNLTLSGTALKNELVDKVTNTHTTFLSYTPGVWNALKQTDLEPSDPSKVILIYGYSDTDGNSNTDRTRGVNNNGGGSTDWNREHVYPKSLGNPNLGTSGPGADAHHLRPADVQRNSSRGNRKFADGSGNSGSTSQGHWYPGDEWKGDVARMMMYMYIRYNNRCLPKNVGVGVAASSDNNMLQLFLEWNAEDPVSPLELQRNPILENIQGNRNPFIDNPAFATQIWGGPQAEDRFGNTGGSDTVAPSIPANLIAANTTQISTNLSWGASTDNVEVTGYDVFRNGTFLSATTTTNYIVSGLTANTTYSFYVKAKDAAGNRSTASTTISVTTQNTSPGGNATALFFSEYIEGSSNNKALEIANFTGVSVNLSEYVIKRQTNGSGSWSGGLSLSGVLANNDVYVAANSSASNTIKNEADLVSGASELSFNGNDPVGLFKNGVLIDIVGTFNGGSSNFAKDATLQRKTEVSSPSSTYTTSEWNSYPRNTFDGLGKHTFSGGGNTGSDTEAPTIPGNVMASNITKNSTQLSWTASTDNIGVTGYTIYQNGTVLTTTTGSTYNVSGLTTGTNYTFKISAFDAVGNTSVLSNSVAVTTLDTVISYCLSKGNTVKYEYIDYVGIGGISNTTLANAGYGDFISQIANLSYGANTIVLSVGFASASYTEHWGVWIDFNKNGTFEGAEKVVSGSTSDTGNLSYNFDVPSTATSGNTRMRVAMKWNGAPTSCETFGYGEVEDYTVNIGSTTGAKGASSIKIDGKLEQEDKVFLARVYPNPATTYVQISLKDDRDSNFTLTNMQGSIIKSGVVTDNKISLEGITSGIYFVTISDGNRSISEKIMIK
ncbi:putative secreted protein (Por secretion system target) [Aquimarina sp. MAR_2010_214]|uniref:endonuclease n=1 Tax=Aquimarina sp. MAR_2010_214 TaxID=1250026 RepID=UPI000C707C19|nr:endonuclease [Aquimarina sp. MAR_2010_214]PKV51651.1 putative secreted protein (Por secretion system target) [Aquimarina sp. MAR_2010_214]